MKIPVDKRLLPMKAHYFLFNAGTAPVVPFMPTLAKQLGFSSVIVGTIYTVLPVVGMLAKPLFGIVGDKFQRHKILFLFFQLLTAIAFFAIMFIPSIPQISPAHINCNEGASFLKFCPDNEKVDSCIKQRFENKYTATSNLVPCEAKCTGKENDWNVICKNWNISDVTNSVTCPVTGEKELDIITYLNMSQIELISNCLFIRIHGGLMNGKNTTMYCPSAVNINCNMSCNDEYIKDTISQARISNDDVAGIYQFWLFFLLLVISWAGMAVVVSVGDAICFEMLGDHHYLYGNQRLWGAVGWGLFSIISGALVDKMSGDSINKDYTIVFYMALVIIGLDMFISTKLQHNQNKISKNILKDVGTIFLSLRVTIFFVWCIIVGLCTALIWNFLFWYLEELGSQAEGCNYQEYMKTLQGLAMGIQCFGGELPFFFLSGWILKKIGHINAMNLVLLGFGVRFILYSFLKNPWWVLPIEFMNGITFGIFYSTMASYASIVAPPGTEATLQGLVGAIFEGVGVSVGSFVGGILFKVIGGRATFFLFGIGALCAFVLHAIIQYLIKKYGSSHGVHTSYTVPNDTLQILDDQEIAYSRVM